MNANVLTTIASLCLLACTAHDIVPVSIQGAFNVESIVKERQQIIYRDAAESIVLTIVDIQESRCPTDMICIWEGYAKVSFSISAMAEIVNLAIPRHQPLNAHLTDTYTFNSGGNTYKLTLKDVTPYPSSKNTSEVKRAVFVLQRE